MALSPWTRVRLLFRGGFLRETKGGGARGVETAPASPEAGAGVGGGEGESSPSLLLPPPPPLGVVPSAVVVDGAAAMAAA